VVTGLWNIAADQPDLTALVDPSGREITYRELAAQADRYGRGFGALGLEPGDSIVLMLPNSAELVAVYFAAYQTGLYVVMANWHLTGAEVAYLVQDSGAKAFVAHERFAAAATEASASLPDNAKYSVGDIDGFTPLGKLGEGEEGRPDVRTTGSPMLYTSGTTGRPKGVRRPLTGADPDVIPPSAPWFFGIFGIKPHDGHVHLCGSPLYHTAVLNFVVISIQLGHTSVLMDHWAPEDMLRLIERHKVTHSHMVPTQFHRFAARDDPRRRAVPARGQTADARVVGTCRDRVLRRDRRRWHGDLRAGMAAQARIRRPAVADIGDQDPGRGRQRPAGG
jgi:long-chain acyl-CoA synthetase